MHIYKNIFYVAYIINIWAPSETGHNVKIFLILLPLFISKLSVIWAQFWTAMSNVPLVLFRLWKPERVSVRRVARDLGLQIALVTRALNNSSLTPATEAFRRSRPEKMNRRNAPSRLSWAPVCSHHTHTSGKLEKALKGWKQLLLSRVYSVIRLQHTVMDSSRETGVCVIEWNPS